MLSAKANADFVSAAIASEVEKGYLTGPRDSVGYSHYRVSPIGVAERKFSGKKRLILDLSSPHNKDHIPSINELISPEVCSLKYTKVDDAINIITKLGVGCLLSKFDIRDAFKIIPIRPDLWPYHCIKWDNKYYNYVRLAFGSRSSPKIFTTLSEALQWIAKNNYGVKHFLYLLDDFLSLEEPGPQAQHTKVKILAMFDSLGIPLNVTKTAGPCTCLEYLGIILDTIKMEARLGVDKMDRISALLENFLQKHTCTKRQLLSLIGHLVFACRVVINGRSFMARLFELTKSVTKLHHKITLTNEARQDIHMWYTLLTTWNGKSVFHDRSFSTSEDMCLYTDSSSSIGFGAYYISAQEYFADTWQNHPIPTSQHAMSYLEMYPVIASAIVWGHTWANKRVLFMVDNEGLVAILNKGRSKCPAINCLLRRLVLVATVHNFTFQAAWLSTKSNLLADLLSRGHINIFQDHAPDAKRVPCPPSHNIAFISTPL